MVCTCIVCEGDIENDSDKNTLVVAALRCY